MDGSRTAAVPLLNITLDTYPFLEKGFEPLASQIKYSETTYQGYDDSCMKDTLVSERKIFMYLMAKKSTAENSTLR